MKKIIFLRIILLFISLPFVALAQDGGVQSQNSADNSEVLYNKLVSQHVMHSVQLKTGASKQDIQTFCQYYRDTITADVNKFTVAVANKLINNDVDVLNYSTNLVNKYVALFVTFQQIEKDYPSTVAEYVNRYHGPTLPACNTTPCDNVNFENGTLSGWTGCYAQNTSGTSSYSTTALTCTGPYGAVTTADNDPNVTGQHPSATNQLYITSGARLDPVTGVPVVCPSGGKYSCMLGDSTICGSQMAFLENTFKVSAATCNFTYYYSVILQNPGHSPAQQPFFNVTMFDQSGDTIPFCGNYSVTSGYGIKGFDSLTYKGSKTYYKPWTTVFVPLQKYIGQCVSVKVEVSDCEPGGHFGYAYFDAQCAPLQIITSSPAICGHPITLTAPPGGASYQWTGPCIVGASNVATITVGCAGKYTVIIQSVIGATCADTLDTVITSGVGITPVPNFKSDTVCAGNPTQFTNLSTGTGDTYLWNFGNGTTDTSDVANPTYTYPAAGTYTATLSATNGGCGGDTSFTVVVNTPPTAGFTATTVCLNNPTVFTNTSAGSATYSWNFGEPSSGLNNVSTAANPSHTYSNCGTYTVSLAVGKAPCVDSAKVVITVNPVPIAAFTSNIVCFGQTTTLTDASTIACGGTITSWAWNFGDIGSGASNTSTLQDPTHLFSDSGKYDVILTPTSNNGCQNSVTIPVTVSPNPVANFTSGPVCLGHSTVFTNKSTGSPVSWNWNFGDATTSALQNPTHTYATTGTFAVKLVIASAAGCTDSITINVVVNPNPTASFTATTVCIGTPTAFTDASAGETSWAWNFGDGATSILQNPTHTYATAGIFNATEVVANSFGCTDSITAPVTVNPDPTGTINITPECLGTANNFTCTTTMVGGTFAWNFGDGGTSILQNPTHTYAGVGSYNVYVVLKSATNCIDTIKGTAVVNPIPVANFSNTTACQGSATLFTDNSTAGGGTSITGWAWSFGDGGTSTVQNPVHVYPACGTYNVILAVTTSAGCSHDTTITITVNPVPTPAFTGTDVCLGLVTDFTDASTIGCGGTINTWAWTFGDGGISALQNPNHIYAAAGTYTVTLKVTSGSGCDSSIQMPITVYPLPVPAFTNTFPCLGNPTNFTDASTVAGGTINGWGWSFGDGGTSTLQDPAHTYGTASTFPVTLVVVSNHGCIDSITKNVTVNPNPAPDFKADDTLGCAPMCVNFTDLSTVANPASVTGWLWNFGDGSIDSSSALQDPKHCYTKVGTFSVTLTVTTNNGCTETFTRVNYITTWPVPVANFSATPNPTVLVNNPTVVFTDLSTGSPITWNWTTFGDNLDSVKNTQNTTHTYQDTGTFYVELSITNKYGCKDSIIEPVIVQPIWTFYIPNAFTPNGDGMNDYFSGKGIGLLSYEMWIFDRWGMQLYHCTDINKPWDGTVQGTDGIQCQIDTYVYLIQITDVFHAQHKYVGKVSIIR